MTTEAETDHRHRYCRRRWKAFYLLSQVEGSLTPREWARYSGIKQHSIEVAVAAWTKYRYIQRHVTPLGYSYSLLAKGRLFVEEGYILAKIRRAELIEEMIEHQRKTGLLHD